MTIFDNYRKLIDEHISFMERMRSIHDEIFGKYADFFPNVKKTLSFDEEKDSESGNTQAEADDDFSSDDTKDITKKEYDCCKCKEKITIKAKDIPDYPKPSKEEQEKRDEKLIKRIHNYLLRNVSDKLDDATKDVEKGERETINYDLGEAKSSKLTRNLNALVEAMNACLDTDNSIQTQFKTFDKAKVKQALLLKTIFYLLGATPAKADAILSNSDCTDLEFTSIMNKIGLNPDIAKAADKVRNVFDQTSARLVENNSIQKTYGTTKEYRRIIELSLGNSYFEFDFKSIAEDYTNTVERKVFLTIDDRRYADDETWHITGHIDFYCVLEAIVHHIIDSKLW